MRKIIIAAAVTVTAVTGVAGVASGSSRSTGTFRFTQRTTGLDLIDVGARGNSLGDQLVFNADLVDARNTKVGRNQGVCTRVSASELLCSSSAVLEGGQITASGLVDFSGPGNGTLAITGGTGIYRKARGEIAVRGVNSPTVGVTARVTG